MTTVLAVDPDMKTPAFACVRRESSGDLRCLYIGVGRVGSKKVELEIAPSLSARALALALRQLPNRPPALGVVEGQVIYSHVRQKPQDILKLGQAAGACVGVMLAWGIPTRMVEPAAWKGQVPKHVCQARAYSKLGWAYATHERKSGSFAIPDGSALEGIERVNVKATGDWKHIGDAVALAVWGCEKVPWFRNTPRAASPPAL